ncbi:toprim domain-containing protein [Pseudovibrio exalbescens]|uniref:DUF7146 domain-containing protein n=1 Tax=Pseudovibrio exalbescens TaxID=197461 RepID=UPI002365DBB8|nr:toprim domain-containing protein [Pseudovibrio exalbescens]MDD7908662.1 toprim domain-containing protein [Pseudovibrio exalbescens]
MSQTPTLKEIKQALQGLQLESVVRDLVPDGRRVGGCWSARCPWREDRKGGSFVVWLGGTAKGAWKDYATGDKGDLIDLICRVLNLDKPGAARWGMERLGWGQMSDQDRKNMRRRIKANATREKREADKKRAEAIAAARRRWAKGQAIEGTVVERYLHSRGIDTSRIPGLLKFCRYLPAQEWWYGAVFEEREVNGELTRVKVKPGPRFPVMMSRMSAADGCLQALHYTFLKPDGTGKADVPDPTKAKLMWPQTQGSIIWVSRGGGPEYAGPCVVGEGIEDAGTAALACPQLMTAAAGSLSGLLHMPTQLPARARGKITGWIILKDNDWGKPQAAALFDRAIKRLEDTGLPVVAVSSDNGKDFNDQLRGVS